MMQITLVHGGERKPVLVVPESDVANVLNAAGLAANSTVMRGNEQLRGDDEVFDGDELRVSPKAQDGGRG